MSKYYRYEAYEDHAWHGIFTVDWLAAGPEVEAAMSWLDAPWEYNGIFFFTEEGVAKFRESGLPEILSRRKGEFIGIWEYDSTPGDIVYSDMYQVTIRHCRRDGTFTEL